MFARISRVFLRVSEAYGHFSTFRDLLQVLGLWNFVVGPGSALIIAALAYVQKMPLALIAIFALVGATLSVALATFVVQFTRAWRFEGEVHSVPSGEEALSSPGALGGMDLPLRWDPPPAPADFTGRRVLVETLEAALTHPGASTPIITLRGMGGSGKTALAARVGWLVAGHFPDGVLWLDLRGFAQEEAPTPERTMVDVIARLDPSAKIPDGPGEIAAHYRATLSGRRLLLILDNARDTAQVEPLLPPPQVTILVTSRNDIHLPGREIFEVHGLAPDEAARFLGFLHPVRRRIPSFRPWPGRAGTFRWHCGQQARACTVGAAFRSVTTLTCSPESAGCRPSRWTRRHSTSGPAST